MNSSTVSGKLASAGQVDELLDGEREAGVEREALRHVAHLRQHLPHRARKQADLPLAGNEPEDRLEQSGLSRAVGADHGDDRLFFNGEADAVQRQAAGEAHGEVLHFQDRRHDSLLQGAADGPRVAAQQRGI